MSTPRYRSTFSPFKRTLLRPILLTLFLAFLLLILTDRHPDPPRVPEINESTKRQFAAHAINNTLIIVPVNEGMLDWADNLLCSLHRHIPTFDTRKIIFWALDTKAQNILDGRGHATYHDPTLFGVSTNENLHYDTAAYKRMMKERPKFFIDVLSTGYDILMLDADTIFFQSPLHFRDDRPGVDAVFSSDAREFYQVQDAFRDWWRRGDKMPPVCNGIFWMRASEKTVRLWQKMLDVLNGGWRTSIYRLLAFQDDQRGMDCLLNDGRAKLVGPFPEGISEDMVAGRYSTTPGTKMGKHTGELGIRLLDQTSVVNGHLLKNRRDQYEILLEELRARGEDRISVHFNWGTTEMTKLEGARKMGLWFLDDQGKCVLDRWNEDREEGVDKMNEMDELDLSAESI